MPLSDLSNPDFQWDVRSNWTQVYQAIERRHLARQCAISNPAGAGYIFDAAVDLRTKAEGYNLQLWATTGFAGPGTINHWFNDLQRAAEGVGAGQAGSTSWPSVVSNAWIDDAAPVGASGINYLDVTAKCGLHGLWRRKRPREIYGATDTHDWWGNAAVPGQRAYLQTGLVQGNYSGWSPIYRCVASGNWVIDTDRPHGPPDELDSDNDPSTNNHVPYGHFEPGDYFGPHLFDELARRLLALKATLAGVGRVSFINGQGSSDRQEMVPPYDDPTATATAFASTEDGAVGLMDDDWHTTGTPAATAGGPYTSNASAYPVGNAQMGASTGYDDFGSPGYSVSGLRNYPDGGAIWTTLGGTMFFVWHDITASAVPWDFSGQGTGMTAGGYVAAGTSGFAAAPDTSTPVIVSYSTNASTPTTDYNSPPAPPPGGPGGSSTTKGCEFRVIQYVLWSGL